MIFGITGYVKPYVRMTRNGKWTNPDANAYLDSKTAIGLQLKMQMSQNGWDMLPAQMPLYYGIRFIVSSGLYKKDLDNMIKAVLDAAQKIVFPNDAWFALDIGCSKEIGASDLAIIEFGVIDDAIEKTHLLPIRSRLDAAAWVCQGL